MAEPVSILDLDPESFEVYFREGQQDRSPEQNQFLLEAYRKRQSSLSPAYDAIEAANQAVADEGRRRLNILPFTVPQGMSFFDAIRAGEQEFAAPAMLMGTAESAADVVDMPSATLRGPVSAEARDQAAMEMSEFLLAGAAPSVARAATQGVDPTVVRMAGLDDDIAALYRYDSPNVMKHIFLDDEYARDVLGEARDPDGGAVADAASQADVDRVREYLKAKTQERLADLPDEITVYRAGDLNERDGVSSFTLNPNYNPDLELPWNDRRGSPGLKAYTVRKEDILVTPDLIRDFGEDEVIIKNSAVSPNFRESRGRAAVGGVDPTVLRSSAPIVRDNPGGRWLEGKVRAAEQAMQEADPKSASARGLTGSTTAYTPEPVLLPVKNVARLSGASGENPRPGTAKYDELLKSVEEEGFRQDRPILVGVNHRGEQYIMEGNNRAAVALATGQEKIPAIVQWYNGGEEIQGRFSPERVQKMAQDSKQGITSLLP